MAERGRRYEALDLPIVSTPPPSVVLSQTTPERYPTTVLTLVPPLTSGVDPLPCGCHGSTDVISSPETAAATRTPITTPTPSSSKTLETVVTHTKAPVPGSIMTVLVPPTAQAVDDTLTNSLLYDVPDSGLPTVFTSTSTFTSISEPSTPLPTVSAEQESLKTDVRLALVTIFIAIILYIILVGIVIFIIRRKRRRARGVQEDGVRFLLH